jgi:hypothetical protein
MTDHSCDRCGDEVKWKNSAGHYRDHCEDCAEEIAEERTTLRDMDDPPRGRADDV